MGIDWFFSVTRTMMKCALLLTPAKAVFIRLQSSRVFNDCESDAWFPAEWSDLFCESSIKTQVHKNIHIHQLYTSWPILNFWLCRKTFLFTFSSNGQTVFSHLRIQKWTVQICIVYRDLISWIQTKIKSCVHLLHCALIKNLNISIYPFVDLKKLVFLSFVFSVWDDLDNAVRT
jgi:hypothetical protein